MKVFKKQDNLKEYMMKEKEKLIIVIFINDISKFDIRKKLRGASTSTYPSYVSLLLFEEESYVEVSPRIVFYYDNKRIRVERDGWDSDYQIVGLVGISVDKLISIANGLKEKIENKEDLCIFIS